MSTGTSSDFSTQEVSSSNLSFIICCIMCLVFSYFVVKNIVWIIIICAVCAVIVAIIDAYTVEPETKPTVQPSVAQPQMRAYDQPTMNIF